jgi:hypothetical protein
MKWQYAIPLAVATAAIGGWFGIEPLKFAAFGMLFVPLIMTK